MFKIPVELQVGFADNICRTVAFAESYRKTNCKFSCELAKGGFTVFYFERRITYAGKKNHT